MWPVERGLLYKVSLKKSAISAQEFWVLWEESKSAKQGPQFRLASQFYVTVDERFFHTENPRSMQGGELSLLEWSYTPTPYKGSELAQPGTQGLKGRWSCHKHCPSTHQVTSPSVTSVVDRDFSAVLNAAVSLGKGYVCEFIREWESTERWSGERPRQFSTHLRRFEETSPRFFQLLPGLDWEC